MINQNILLHIIVTTNKASNNRNIDFKFENMSFIKLPKRILMIKQKIYVWRHKFKKKTG